MVLWSMGMHGLRAQDTLAMVNTQPSFGLAYLYIDVEENGKIKQFKTGDIKGSKAQMKKNITAYIKKYVPNSGKAKCKIALQYHQINKNTSMGQKKKTISGDGAMIHQNMEEVLYRLM